MTRRYPPAKWNLPLVINPPKKLCFTVEVPDDPYHIAAFRGALLALAAGYNWQDDPDHLAREVAIVWRDIVDNVLPCIACPDGISIEEMEYEMSVCEQLRIHNGKLQGLCCGVWSDIEGQEGITIGGPGQQGGGAPQPPAGGCQSYHVQFNANSTYLVPTVVNSGDVLTVSNAEGSGADGALLGSWYCPDGGTFFAGGCLPIYTTDGGDPNPAISHMAIVALIDGVYYPAFGGVITVPGGVTNAQVVIMVNDSTITDNSGSYALDIDVCNNAIPDWSHVLNLALSQNGFAVTIRSGGTLHNNGQWAPGVGFEATLVNDATNSYTFLGIKNVFGSATTLKAIAIQYSEILGTNGGAGSLSDAITYLDVGLVEHNLVSVAAASGSPKTLPWVGSQLSYGIGVRLWVGDELNPTDPGGSAILPQITVSGSGFDPWA